MVLVFGEIFEELNEKAIVVKSSLVVISVVIHIRVVGIGKSHTHWSLHCINNKRKRAGRKGDMSRKFLMLQKC